MDQSISTIIIFVHIEKAAGTTLNHILRCNYLFRHYDVRPFSKKSKGAFQPEDFKLALKINPFLKSISGHSIRPFINLSKITNNLRYITVLRDPIRRYISRFHYLKHKFQPSLTFEDFLRNKDSHNFQVRKIAGDLNVEKAKTILKERFFHVGITEEFDLFLVSLKMKLEPEPFNPGYRKQNVALKKREYEVVKQELLKNYKDAIIDCNKADMKLYEFVKNELLEKDKENFAKELNRELRQFRESLEHFKWPAIRYLDYLYRKLYLDPLTGFIRIRNGLPYKGSY